MKRRKTLILASVLISFRAALGLQHIHLHAYVSYKLQPSDLLIILLPIYFILN